MGTRVPDTGLFRYNTEAQGALMRGEIAVIMAATLADAAALAIEPDGRAENDVGCRQSCMICWLPRAPWPFFQRLARSPATKVHRLDAGGMVGQGERARLGHSGEHPQDVGFVAPPDVRPDLKSTRPNSIH